MFESEKFVEAKQENKQFFLPLMFVHVSRERQAAMFRSCLQLHKSKISFTSLARMLQQPNLDAANKILISVEKWNRV